MAHLSKYGVARKIRIPMVKRGVVDHAVSADWTPVAGDVKLSKDGGAAANVTNLPTAIAMGNSTLWEFSLTATEMEAEQVNVTIADSATKAVEDSGFDVETYGNASAQHAFDLDTPAASLDAAAVRAAVGLASANLDTQLSTIAGYIDTEIATILAAVDAEVAQIKTKTDNLPASPAAAGDSMALTTAAVDAILDEVVEGSTTMRQMLRGFASALLGKASGLNTATAKYRDLADTKDRISGTVDVDGNRAAVTLDLS